MDKNVCVSTQISEHQNRFARGGGDYFCSGNASQKQQRLPKASRVELIPSVETQHKWFYFHSKSIDLRPVRSSLNYTKVMFANSSWCTCFCAWGHAWSPSLLISQLMDPPPAKTNPQIRTCSEVCVMSVLNCVSEKTRRDGETFDVSVRANVRSTHTDWTKQPPMLNKQSITHIKQNRIDRMQYSCIIWTAIYCLNWFKHYNTLFAWNLHLQFGKR